MQRIQVGIIGLVCVLLFVSLANVVIERTTLSQETNQAPGGVAVKENSAAEAIPDEPFAELGVAPAAENEQIVKEKSKPTAPPTALQNIKPAAE
jgi:hypothetical protein